MFAEMAKQLPQPSRRPAASSFRGKRSLFPAQAGGALSAKGGPSSSGTVSFPDYPASALACPSANRVWNQAPSGRGDV